MTRTRHIRGFVPPRTLLFCCLGLSALGSCTLPPPVATGGDVVGGGNALGSQRPIFITDRYGDRFDVTHAIHQYGMRVSGFEFGIGKNTIKPLNHPDMVSPGEAGYPAEGSMWNRGPDVIGLALEDEVRSYPVHELTRHEVVNETIGHTEAAVAY